MSEPGDFWVTMGRAGQQAALVDGTEIRKGSRVVLRPKAGGDIFDIALAGKAAVVEAIEEDAEGRLHVSVTLDDDPGRDLGEARVLGHRFFFGVDEIEPLADASGEQLAAAIRILVAGIGNIFLGDDGFGVAVANRLIGRERPAGVDVVDFGIRGMDLAFALQDPYDAVIFVDASPRGERPGTLSIVEPDLDVGELGLETHAMDPVRVLGLAQAIGRVPPLVRIVACEPALVVHGGHDEDLVGELSPVVEAAADEAVRVVEALVGELTVEIETTRKVVEG